MLESRVERHLVREVEKRGGEVRKLIWLGRRHAPDRIVFWPRGVVHFVELKAPGKKPRDGQTREHARLQRLGQLVYVLDAIEKVDSYVGFYG